MGTSGFSQEELENVAEEKDVETSLLHLQEQKQINGYFIVEVIRLKNIVSVLPVFCRITVCMWKEAL